MSGAVDGDRWGGMMRSAMAGDAAAYRRLLDEIARSLRRSVQAVLTRAGQGNADVEDIVQETLLAIHMKRQTWRQDDPFGPWLNAIVRYKSIDAMRRRGLRRHVDLEDVAETIAAEAPEAGAARDVERLLGSLGEKERAIVRGMSLEGRSGADVAARLGMTEVAVRVSLHRALKKLARVQRDTDA